MRRKVRRQLSIEPDEVIPGNRRPLLPQECADARRQSDFELALIEPLVLHNRVQEFRFLSLVEPSTRQKSASKSAESSYTRQSGTERPAREFHATYSRLSSNPTACLRTASEMFAPDNSNTRAPCVTAGESARQAAVVAAPAASATRCSSTSRCLI